MSTAQTPTTPSKIHLTSPADLVRLIPRLFGFQPNDSVILVALRDKTVVRAARVDIATLLDPDGLGDPDVLNVRLELVTAVGSELIVIGWSDDEALAERGVDKVKSSLADIPQTIVVSNGRCRVDGEDWADCSGDLTDAIVVAMPVLGSRGELAATVAGPGDDPAATARWNAARRKIAELTTTQRIDRAAVLLKRGVDDLSKLSEDELAELAALAHEGVVRDRLWAHLTSATAARHVALWRAVVKLMPDAGAIAPLGLLGMAAWVDGDGALQVCCVERGRAIDPGHSLLRLVETINLMGVDPKNWDKMRQALMAEPNPGDD